MLVKIKEGMRFISNDNGQYAFEVKKYDFYGEGKIFCAFTERSIYPLDEIVLSSYSPIIDNKIINEPNTYIY